MLVGLVGTAVACGCLVGIGHVGHEGGYAVGVWQITGVSAAVAKRSGLAEKGDAIVITGGQTIGRTGNTSLIKYEVLR